MLLKDHNPVTPVWLEPAVPRSLRHHFLDKNIYSRIQVKHSNFIFLLFQLSLALADLALQMVTWKGPTNDLVSK